MELDEIKVRLKQLVSNGYKLYMCMIYETSSYSEINLTSEFKGAAKKIKNEMGSFKDGYQTWYSEALEVISQLLPRRIDDFISYYKPERNRKSISHSTYTVSDYLQSISRKDGLGRIIISPAAALPKFYQQKMMLQAAESTLDSALMNIRRIAQADLFDNELDTAEELKKGGFLRAAGAIAGVVLECHLLEICTYHGIKSRKKAPGISDYNELLKKNDLIDVPMWRKIQLLADLRNLCDHKKSREPKIDDIDDLIAGVRKITKNLF